MLKLWEGAVCMVMREITRIAYLYNHQASASALAGRAAQRGTEWGHPEPVCIRGGAHKCTPLQLPLRNAQPDATLTRARPFERVSARMVQ